MSRTATPETEKVAQLSKFGSRTGRFAQSRKDTHSVSKHLHRFGCIGPVMTGRPWRIRHLVPQRSRFTIWISLCLSSSAPRLVLLSFGQQAIAGKDATTRSLLTRSRLDHGKDGENDHDNYQWELSEKDESSPDQITCPNSFADKRNMNELFLLALVLLCVLVVTVNRT